MQRNWSCRVVGGHKDSATALKTVAPQYLKFEIGPTGSTLDSICRGLHLSIHPSAYPRQSLM